MHKRLSPIATALLFLFYSADTLATPFLTPQTGSEDKEESKKNIEKIVVTGQKIDRAVQDSPASVTVITPEIVENEGLTNFNDILLRTPNVSANNGSGFNIRGIDSLNVSNGGRGGLAGVYIDGAPLPQSIISRNGFSTWDISQVEVLRGPQSTLRGKSSLAGAVVMSTQDAVHTPHFKARLGVGEYGKREGAVAFGGSLIDKELAFRFAGESRQQDGYNYNVATGTESDYEEKEFLRAKLRYTPTNLPRFEAQLSFTRSTNEEGPDWVATTSGHQDYPINDIFDDRFVYLDSPTFLYADMDLTVLDLSYDISPYLLVTLNSTHTDTQSGFEWDDDGTMTPPQSTRNSLTDEDTVAHELQFTYEKDALSGIVGLYYSDTTSDNNTGGERGLSLAQLGLPTLLVAPPDAGGLGLPGGVAQLVLEQYSSVDPLFIDRAAYTFQSSKTQALFADFTYELNENWDIFGGFRYDKETQSTASNTDVQLSSRTVLPDPNNYASDPMLAQVIGGINAQLRAMISNASGDEPLKDGEFEAWLPKAGITYSPNTNVSLSLSAQQGYRSGGVGVNTARGETFRFDPEYTWNYEAALRSAWLDEQLIFNGNLFYIDWTDQQVNVALSGNSFDSETRNVGESHVKGFEIESRFMLTNDIEIYSGLGYAKSEFDRFSQVVGGIEKDFSGRSFAGAPEWTGLIGFNMATSNGITFNVNASYTGSSQRLTIPMADGLDPRNDPYWMLNSRVAYNWGNYSVSLLGNNLTESEAVSIADAGFGNQTLTPPRSLLLRFEAAF